MGQRQVGFKPASYSHDSFMSTKIKAHLQQLLSQEQGAVVREWGARFPVALVYPQVYPVAMGNLGFQTMYHLLNAHPGFVCERAFLPTPEEADEHRRTRTPILTLESQRPLKDFAAVAFSISFEADYPYVLDLLAGAGIPLRAAERGPGDPLVLAGGVATFLNPEPLAPFVDAFFLGEGEAGAMPFFEFLAAAAPAPDRAAMLRDLARTVPGAYVPAGYTPRYHPDGTLAAFEAAPGFPDRVVAPHLAELAPYPTHSHLLAPQSEWGEMFLVETGRGCSRGCRFCAAGFVYRPPRERDLGGPVDPGRAGGHGPAQDRPGGRRGERPPRHPRPLPENSGRRGYPGHQFAPGRLRRRRALATPGPRRGAQRRPGPGGRQRPPAPGHQQGPHPGRPGAGRGGREPRPASASSASTSWWACPPRPWTTWPRSPAWRNFWSTPSSRQAWARNTWASSP